MPRSSSRMQVRTVLRQTLLRTDRRGNNNRDAAVRAAPHCGLEFYPHEQSSAGVGRRDGASGLSVARALAERVDCHSELELGQ